MMTSLKFAGVIVLVGFALVVGAHLLGSTWREGSLAERVERVGLGIASGGMALGLLTVAFMLLLTMVGEGGLEP